jgi:methyl-accepting chemotaxis protein
MNFIYNAKLTVKFLGSFFILIAAMIFIGVWGIVNMSNMNATTDFIYRNNFLSTTYVDVINNNLTEARLTTLKITMEEYADDMEANLATIQQLNDSTSENLALYESNIAPDKPEDRRLFDIFKDKLATFRGARDAVIALAQEGKYADAVALNNAEAIPAAVDVQASVNDLVAFNSNDALAGVNQGAAEFASSTTVTIIILVIAVILALAIGIFMSTIITRPLNAVRDVADKISNGDLTAKLPEKYLLQKDEIGALANNIESMKRGLVETVSGIKDSTDNLGMAVDSTNATLNVLNDRITDASAATEELSAGMEETGASAQEMNATAAEIERAVETVAEKAEEGANKSGEIHNRASELGKNVNSSIDKSNHIFTEIKTSLEKALEDSKAVDEINALADAILGITSQTTLLALNASIEAARAGEAGRGFAVVANEISALADNSKNTVTQIQAITKVVMSAVNALAGSSTNLLNFVANEVMRDYNDMLSAADSYSHDAVYMSDMTSDLSATSEELLASVQVLLRAINEVAAAAQEGARTTTIVAEQTTDISVNASTIVANMNETQNTSNQLVGLVNKFKL